MSEAQNTKVVQDAYAAFGTATSPRCSAEGKAFEAGFAMVFTLRGGKIAAFREFTDSAGINAAFA
jgi:ketosteroid isomerase-like protein